MQTSAVFFGGAVVGAVIAAACGLDLFPEDREGSPELEAARDEAQKARAAGARAKAALDAAEARARALAERAEKAEKVDLAAKAAREREATQTTERAEAGRLRAEIDQRRGEDGRLRAELASARTLAAHATAEVGRIRSEARDLLRHLFARERDPADAAVVSRYLATASKEDQQALILALIPRNKHLLLEMPAAPAGGGTEPDAAALKPAAAPDAEGGRSP
ncbi:MAG: hypothetical protein HY721_07915 [Planctomycetes bacterium]|nr:hypothetical protein [Planctomycetota bacterium]